MEAVAGADAVYTDVWASMGQEAKTAERARIFATFQVNEALMSHAAQACAVHALPAGASGKRSDGRGDRFAAVVVFDQAENRLHIQKSILLMLLGGGASPLPGRGARMR